MTKQIITSMYIARSVARHGLDEFHYRKEMKTRRQAEARYDEAIRASQEKIGPYVPQPCPKQIWA